MINTVTCKTTTGIEFTIDDADREFVESKHWYPYRNNYLCTYHNGKNIRLHRYLVGAKPGEYTDHIDGNTLNNVRANLRICTSQQNNFNRRKLENKSSKYKGVVYVKRCDRWRSEIRINGIKKSLGFFITEEEAAKAYDKMAKIYQREFARLNFPEKEGEL